MMENNPICYFDFVPKMLQAEQQFSTFSLTGSPGGPKYEIFSALVNRANAWLRNQPRCRPIHLEILEVDGVYSPLDSQDSPTPAYLKILRLWYVQTEGGSSEPVERAVQIDYLHLLPSRLEANPRSFCPRFQSLQTMLEVANSRLESGDIVINGNLLSIQTSILRFNSQNCSLDPDRTFWMINNPDDVNICYYMTIFYCISDSNNIHKLGYKDIPPEISWSGSRRKKKQKSQVWDDVMDSFRLWLSEKGKDAKIINMQTIDHPSYWHCASENPGYEERALSNPHFRTSLLGLMQSAKVLRLYFCTCTKCQSTGKDLHRLKHKSFHIEKCNPRSEQNFSNPDVGLLTNYHKNILSRINEWTSRSGARVVNMETVRLCMADPKCRITAENATYQSSAKSTACAIYAIRLYVTVNNHPTSAHFMPEPLYIQQKGASCQIL